MPKQESQKKLPADWDTKEHKKQLEEATGKKLSASDYAILKGFVFSL
jgi:hypothetical protein